MTTRRKMHIVGAALALTAAAFVSSSPAVAAEPQRGGTFIIGLGGEPSNLTAHLSTNTPALMVAGNIFSKLIDFDVNMQPIPDLAQRWDISEDGKTYTFYLNEKATWHDGKPVTAEDVAFTFSEIIAKHHPRAGAWWPYVESAKALDEHTFQIKLKQVYAPFLSILGEVNNAGTLIMPKHIYEGTDIKNNPANFAPVGSGAFKFKEWSRGSHVELVRNENYWKPGLPYLDRIILQFLPDATSRLLAFERADVDYLHFYITPHSAVARLRKDPRFKIVSKGGQGSGTNEFLLLNLRNQYLQSRKVRQAITYALDRQEVKDKALFGLGEVAHSHLHSGSPMQTAEFDTYEGRNIAKANQLLDEAGYPRKDNGERFSLRIYWSAGREYEGRAAEVVRDHLDDVGIDVVVQTFDRPTFIDRLFKKWDFDMAHQLFTSGPDPTRTVSTRYHTKQIKRQGFVNGMGYSNPNLDEIFDTEFKIADPQKRKAVWADAQRILMRDLPTIPLFEMPVVNAVSAKFEDVITTPYLTESREETYMVKP